MSPGQIWSDLILADKAVSNNRPVSLDMIQLHATIVSKTNH